MNTPKTSQRKMQFIRWLDTQTDSNAWLTHTYREIADMMSPAEDKAAPSTVREVLASVMSKRLSKPPSEVLKQKKEYRTAAQGRMTSNKLAQLKQWRTQENPMEIVDCADKLGMSVNTIKHHLKQLGLDA